MAEALVQTGRWLRWVGPDGRVADECVIDPRPDRVAEILSHGPSEIPPAVRDWVVRHARGSPIQASDEALQQWLASEGVAAVVPAPEELRRLRETAFRPDREERALLLALARRRLAEAMKSPEASLIALTREHERVERVVRRETNAAASWVSEGAAPLAEYARQLARTREELSGHLTRLTTTLEGQVRQFAPNLSAVVGPVVAARLVTAAGGLRALAKMDASRVQLLGARRRFGPGRTPRFGILYHAEGMARVPPRRAGAFARSLSGLAVIAARVDSTSRRPIASMLLARRDRRIARLSETLE